MDIIEKVREIATPIIDQNDCILFDVTFKKEGKDLFLRLFVDKKVGKIDLDLIVKISEQLSSYCELYECEQYETVNNGSFKEFILKKQYFDYNGVQNNIEIITKYDYKSIVSVTAFIYSEKEMFSENLIKEQLKGYFDNFNCKLSEEKIKEAFDNRFIGKITNDNLTYQVIEIYDNNQLQKIKTKITLSLR